MKYVHNSTVHTPLPYLGGDFIKQIEQKVEDASELPLGFPAMTPQMEQRDDDLQLSKKKIPHTVLN